MADGQAGHNYWWIAPVRDVAKIAFERMKLYIRKAGLTEHFITNEQEQSILYPHGVKLWFKGAEKPDHLYGEDVYGAVVDEATRVREASWHALRSTLTSTRGQVKIIGNVKGKRNWAYKLARKAEITYREEPTNSRYAYFKLTAWDAVDGGILDADEVRDAKEVLPESVYKELYLAEPADDGSNPFGLEAIRKCVMQRLATTPTIINGVDLGKRTDYTWRIGLDRSGRMTASDRWRRISWPQTKDRLAELCKGVKTLCDSTGVGDAIVDDLMARKMNIEGFVFTMPSKQQIMEALAVDIQQGAIGIYGETLIDELEIFEFEYTRLGVRYTAPAGFHDDGVCALALANWVRRSYTETFFEAGDDIQSVKIGERYSGHDEDEFEDSSETLRNF